MGSLDFIKPIAHLLPEVKAPERPPNLNERLMWTGVAILIFFVMYNVAAVGVSSQLGTLDFLSVVTAARLGSLVTTGIGPIVLASIFLQLFVGAKIINVNMSDPEEKATFHATQKVLAVLLCFFEAAVYVLFARIPLSTPYVFGGLGITEFMVIAQIALGSLVLLYLDEVVSKHGLGSGISLFIAAGVSLSVVGGAISLFTADNGVIATLSQGGSEALPNAIIALAPLFFTILVFLIVVYAEGIKVELPLAFERARGLGGKFPIKFLYVSNIPVILASALLLNMQFFTAGLAGASFVVKELGNVDIMPYIAYVDSSKQVRDGALYLITPIYRSVNQNFLAYVTQLLTGSTPILHIPQVVHVIVYVVFMVLLCILFGQFWVETTGMGPKEVAAQLSKSGLQIPGYRRDPRIVEKVLERYIPMITILGSAFVGLLASMADLTGALGTGTGILLTVGIVHKLYEELEAQRAFDSYPAFASLFGD